MKLHELAPRVKKPAKKRLGQGRASGQGTYAGRGGDGQKSRSGGGVRPGFEGGQTSLIKRMPKLRGFRNPNRVQAQTLNLTDLAENFKDGDTVNFASLIEKKMVTKTNDKIKVLGDGEISCKLTLDGIKVSASAKTAIEKAGGSIKA